MFCHLNYQVDKEYLRTYFYKHYEKGKWHRFNPPVLMWWKLFKYDHVVEKIMDDLGITDMNVKPRFSFQLPHTRLVEHLDYQRIVGINFNLEPETTPDLHIYGKDYPYEACLADVGSVEHSVEKVPYERLILKFAIRELWQDIFDVLESRGLIDEEKTKQINPDYKNYESVIKERDEKYLEGKYLANQLLQYTK